MGSCLNRLNAYFLRGVPGGRYPYGNMRPKKGAGQKEKKGAKKGRLTELRGVRERECESEESNTERDTETVIQSLIV